MPAAKAPDASGTPKAAPDLSLNLETCDHGESLAAPCHRCNADAGLVAVVLTPRQAKRLEGWAKDQQTMGWSVADARALMPLLRGLHKPSMAGACEACAHRPPHGTAVQVKMPWQDLVRCAAALRDRASDEWQDGAYAFARALWSLSEQLDPAGHRGAGRAPWEA